MLVLHFLQFLSKRETPPFPTIFLRLAPYCSIILLPVLVLAWPTGLVSPGFHSVSAEIPASSKTPHITLLGTQTCFE